MLVNRVGGDGGLKPDQVRAWMRFPLTNANLNPQFPVNPVNNIEVVYPNGKLLVNLSAGVQMQTAGFGLIFSYPVSSDIGDVEVSSIFQYRSNSNPSCVEAKVNPAAGDFDIVHGKEGNYPDNGIQGDYFYAPLTDEYIQGAAEVVPEGYFQNLIGTITYTGTYAADIQTGNEAIGFNANGDVLLIKQNTLGASYENYLFTLVSVPAGSGITLQSHTSVTANNTSNIYYGAILKGVTQPINITLACNTRNTTNDYYQIDITVAYA